MYYRICFAISASFGFGTGAGEGERPGRSFSAGVGAQVSPSALVVLQDGDVKIFHLEHRSTLDKLVDILPTILEKLGQEETPGPVS
ncbi:MAG TPA: hypothetical protein GXX19_03970 [Syntrophomonadaceae bacterium]|nr:hypothetical protein [Syntrophomonadaceae bacterium]